jgi:hypothetical protein
MYSLKGPFASRDPNNEPGFLHFLLSSEGYHRSPEAELTGRDKSKTVEYSRYYYERERETLQNHLAQGR